jgi:hypothetical protein
MVHLLKVFKLEFTNSVLLNKLSYTLTQLPEDISGETARPTIMDS